MSLISVVFALIPHILLSEGWLRFILVVLSSIISIVIFSFVFVFTKGEKEK